MANFSMSRNQLQKLVTFCKTNKVTNVFLVKDEGIYILARGKKKQLTFYFNGYDPTLNEDWYEKARTACGGDDFAESIPLEPFLKLLAQKVQGKFPKKYVISLTKTAIRFNIVI